MEPFKNKVLFFADLDDSMFQTKRKDINGKHKATYPKNILKTSYYTKAQQAFLNFVLNNNDIVFIPLTARTEDQFKRTQIYKKGQSSLYAIYYGSILYMDNQEYKPYTKHIAKELQYTFKDLEALISATTKKFPQSNFVNVDGRYFTTDSKDPQLEKYLKLMISKKYGFINMYVEEKYITLLPEVANKKSVVQFLTKKLKPKFTIGIGNSESDIDFLNLCDFKIISHIGSLQAKLLKD